MSRYQSRVWIDNFGVTVTVVM